MDTRIHQGSKNFADRKALRAYTVAHSDLVSW